jgi:hypothetical protein
MNGLDNYLLTTTYVPTSQMNMVLLPKFLASEIEHLHLNSSTDTEDTFALGVPTMVRAEAS